MENATKALLIAGSVLVAILLIAMGVKIFNSTSETTESAQKTMDATAATQFNQQFVDYNGKQKGNKVIDLLNKVLSSNSVNDINTSEKRITIHWKSGTAWNPNTISSWTHDIERTKEYDITIKYNEKGLVSDILINNGGQ